MDRKKQQSYTEEQIRRALADIDKGLSIRAVSRAHDIPRQTLQRKMKEGATLATHRGPSTLFSTDQEHNIAIWIKHMAQAGFPVTKETLLHNVQKLATECGVTFPGERSIPGRKWYEAFLRRHPEITMRTSQNLVTRRRDVSQQDLDRWFLEVETYIKDNKLDDMFLNPQRIFNCDETAFFLNPKPGKVLAEKGSKKVYTAAGADEKLNMTVLLTANAAGEIAPPMIVYRYVRVPQHVAEAVPSDWAIGRSENGWMTQETFYEYMANFFEPYLKHQNIPRPVILFMDGHTSHISFALSSFCKKHQIELVALFPNATHLIQPMDVAVFHTLKNIWRQEVVNFRMQHDGQQLEKHTFPQVLQLALDQLTPETIRNGFKTCGLVPWDPKKVTITQSKARTETPAAITKKDMVLFAKILEIKIGDEKLRRFRESDREWHGPIEQLDLYNLWKETKESLISLSSQSVPEFNQSDLVETNQDATDNNNHSDSVITRQSIEVFEPWNVAGPSRSTDQATQPNESITTSTSTPQCIPSPFKRALFWPDDGNKDEKKKKKREKLPAVVTSPQMLQYYQKREEIKKSKAAEQERKRSVREQRKKEKVNNKNKVARKAREMLDEVSSSEGNSLEMVEFSDFSWDENEDTESEKGENFKNKSDLKEGSFVLITFLGGRRNSTKYIYLCVIQEIQENTIRVQGLRSAGNKKEFFIVENDVSDVPFTDIVGIVQQPELAMKDRKILYKFCENLSVREK